MGKNKGGGNNQKKAQNGLSFSSNVSAVDENAPSFFEKGVGLLIDHLGGFFGALCIVGGKHAYDKWRASKQPTQTGRGPALPAADSRPQMDADGIRACCAPAAKSVGASGPQDTKAVMDEIKSYNSDYSFDNKVLGQVVSSYLKTELNDSGGNEDA